MSNIAKLVKQVSEGCFRNFPRLHSLHLSHGLPKLFLKLLFLAEFGTSGRFGGGRYGLGRELVLQTLPLRDGHEHGRPVAGLVGYILNAHD